MTFISPGFLWAAIAVAAGIVALHFIVTRQPRASILPTARFVPDSAATATVRDTRPNDLLLMLLRVLIVLATGAALARPMIKPKRETSGRIFLVDDSRAVANIGEVSDSVKQLYRAGDRVVLFDSTARSIGANVDSLRATRKVDGRGNISAALIAAMREGSAVRDNFDSLELVIVSPVLDEEHDAATDSIRKLWRGRARLVRVSARVDSAVVGNGKIDIRSTAGDGLVVTTSLASNVRGAGGARIIRGAITADDSAWAEADDRVLVVWPITDRPPFAVVRTPADQSGGIATDSVRLVAAFDRHWTYPDDSTRGARIAARWADGEPAVVEKPLGRGCIRSVAIPLVNVGDLVIRPEFVALVKQMAEPCGDSHQSQPASTSVMATLSGGGGLAESDAFAARSDIPSPLAPWLLAIALVAAFAEMFLRRGRSLREAARA